MVMPPSGTFEYSTTVPQDGLNSLPWPMESGEHLLPTGDRLLDNRLVGWSPHLYVRDTNLPPDPRLSHPAVHRTEIQLVATDKKHASLDTVSYFLDTALVRVLKPEDIFHIARTACGGVGVSVLRSGKLVFAVGAVAAVPLGNGVSVKTPFDLVGEAERIFHRQDPEFKFTYLPIEVHIGGNSRILFRGLAQMGGYHVWVSHGFLLGVPGVEECVSISVDRACKWVWASASAQLLASH